MSKKILRVGASIAAIAVNFIPGVGQLASLAITAALTVGSAVLLKPRAKTQVPSAAVDRLNASLDPQAPRKMVLGKTAMATDIRYQAFTSDQTYLHWIMVLASHEAEGGLELWFDTTMAWSQAGGVTATYTGYLEVTARNPGTSGNGIAIDSTWTATATLTGCAYLHIRFKLTGNTKKAESPFAQSVPTRVTVRGKGAKLPDIREGTVDATDQSTWDWFDDDSGRNPALQLLFYLLGWRINDKLAVGRGIPAARIDLDSFADAANACDESVALSGGGTEPRYRAGAVISEADDPESVISMYCAAMNAVLRDNGGKISLHVLANDLSEPDILTLSDDDILGNESWRQTPPVDQIPNVVRGRYTDTSDAGLYQLADYPEVSLTSLDGIERIETFELAPVESGSQAQRLGKQKLQRAQYPGTYAADFGVRAWRANLGHPVKLTHRGLGWTDKLFRVAAQGIRADGTCPLVLEEEHEDIYAWDAEESASVVPAAPTAYDPVLAPVVEAIGDLEDDVADITGDIVTIVSQIGNLEAAVDGKITTFNQSPTPTAEGEGDLWFRTSDGKWYIALVAGADEITAGEWVLVEDSDIGVAILAASDAQATADSKIVTFYQDSTPTAEGVGDLWVDSNETPLRIRRWNGSAWVVITPASLADLDAVASAALTGKITTFYQSGTPTSTAVNDLWFLTSTGKWYRAAIVGADAIASGEWELVEDAGIAQAITDAAGAQATADGKVTTFYQGSEPTAEGEGDLWVDSDETPLRVRRWNGSAWEVVTPASLAELDAVAAAALAAATAALDDAADDGLLSRDEKFRDVLPADRVLRSRYHALLARAAAIGITAASKNLLLHSQDFDDSDWTKTNSGSGSVLPSVTANAAVAPDGTLTADRITFDRGTGTTASFVSSIRQTVTAAASTPHSVRVFLKSANGKRQKVLLYLYAVASAFTEERVFDVGPDWTEAEISLTTGSGATSLTISLGSEGGFTPDCDRALDLYVWGAQIDESLIPRPYVRTTDSAVTQSAAGTAAANLHSAFVDYVGALEAAEPDWDDVDEDSQLIPADNALAITDFTNAGWTKTSATAAIATLADTGFYTLSDADGGVAGLVRRSADTIAAGVHTIILRVKKDSTPRATRAPAVLVSVSGGGDGFFMVDTMTGELYDPSNEFDVIDGDDEWIIVGENNYTAAGTVTFDIYPAFASTFTGSSVAATTGSILARLPQVFPGTIAEVARASFRSRLAAFAQRLDELAKAISETDGVTSLQIDGPKHVIVNADSTGDPSESLPVDIPLTANIGLSTVTDAASWSVTVLTASGSVACTIGASTGVLNVTDMDTTAAEARVDCEYLGVSQSHHMTFERKDAQSTSAGGDGSSGDNSVYVWQTINSTTWTLIATLPITAASATPALTANNFNLMPSSPPGSVGSWNVEMKWVRENGVTDTDIGSTANSNPDPLVYDDPVLVPNQSQAGAISCSANDSGLTPGNAYTYYLQARLSSGSRSIIVSGTALVES